MSIMHLTNGNVVMTSRKDAQFKSVPCVKRGRVVRMSHISNSPSNEVNEVYRKLYEGYTKLILESL